MRLKNLQEQKRLLQNSENEAFEHFIRDSGIDDLDDDPTIMQQVKDQLSEIWRGPAFSKHHLIDLE